MATDLTHLVSWVGENLGTLCAVLCINPATLEAEARVAQVEGQPGQSRETLSQNKVEEELGRLLSGPACVSTSTASEKETGAGTMAQWLKAVVILAEDPGSIFSTSMSAYNQGSKVLFWPR